VQYMQLCNYNKALSIFRALVILQPLNILYIKCIAGCLHGQKLFAEASSAYDTSFSLDMQENADCLFYSGVCLFKLKDFNGARDKLTKYLNTSHTDMRDRAELYLNAIVAQLEDSTEYNSTEDQ
jgi:tetratricopeptide (TPR) repeat protein